MPGPRALVVLRAWVAGAGNTVVPSVMLTSKKWFTRYCGMGRVRKRDYGLGSESANHLAGRSARHAVDSAREVYVRFLNGLGQDTEIRAPRRGLTSYGVSQMLVNSSMRYGADEMSAFCAKKLTRRLPLVIMLWSVGHAS